MWKGLDNTQLEIDGENCNNLKEEEFKYKKKTWWHMSTNPPSTCHKKRKSQLYIYRLVFLLHLTCSN